MRGDGEGDGDGGSDHGDVCVVMVKGMVMEAVIMVMCAW